MRNRSRSVRLAAARPLPSGEGSYAGKEVGPASPTGAQRQDAPADSLRTAPAWSILLVFLVLAVLLFHAAWRTPRTAWVGSCCDPEQGVWFLRWVPYALEHLRNPFYTHHINFPTGVNLMWNTSVSLPGLLLSPVSLLLGPVVAYNAYMTLGVALSAWCAYLLLRRYAQGIIGPAIGATLYGFSPYVLSQATQHAHLVLIAVPPLLFLVLDEIVVRQRRAAAAMGVLLGVLAAAQLLIAEELLAMAGIAAAIGLAVLAAMRPGLIRPKLLYARRAAIWAGVSFGVLAAFPLAMQFFGPGRIHGYLHRPDVYVTDLLNFLVPTSVQAIAPPAAATVVATFTGFEHEDNAYLGVPLLLLLGYVAKHCWSRASVRVATIVGLVIAVLSLGPHLHIAGRVTGIVLPWAGLAHLPLMENILPSRITVYMYLCAGVLLAVFLEDKRPRRQVGTALAVTIVALLPLWPRQPYPAWKLTTIPPLFTAWLKSGIPDGSVVLVAPLTNDGAGADAMLWQAEAGDAFRMPNGYLLQPDANGQRSYDAQPNTLFKAMDDVQRGGAVLLDVPTRRAIAGDVRAHSIDAVIVGPMRYHEPMVAFFTDLFGRGPEEVSGVAIWRHVRAQDTQTVGP